MPSMRGVAGICVTLVLLCNCCDAKICGSIRAQNNVKDLEQLRDCKIITGNLAIVLMENDIQRETWRNYTFPNLTEIWDYLLVFRVHGLRSLGTLFPNLRIIKGLKTLANHALALYSNGHLEQIGLNNLKRIERGTVYIANCVNLCYYDTIDWKILGTDLLWFNQSSENCPSCSTECKKGIFQGHCWSSQECQDPEIVKSCDKFRDLEKCVEKCPENKVILHPGNECITLEQCKQIDLKRPWFEYNKNCTNKCPDNYQRKNNTCIYCGSECVFECTPNEIVSSLATVKAFEGCTHINGSLHFTVKDMLVAEELEKYMSKIKEISGFLKVTRSPAITSLEFLKSLKLIKGETLENGNSLIVLNNPKLKTLWNFRSNFTLKIGGGKFLFHFNPQLCYKDIEHLNNLTLQMKFTELQVSEASNGDQRLCQEFLLNIQESIIHPTNATLHWEIPFHDRKLRGYFVYYIESDAKDYVTKDKCASNVWNVKFTSENTVILKDLKPFTEYSFYIVVSLLATNAQQKTKFHNFTTLSDVPTSPLNVEILSYNSTALKLQWKPPSDKRGKLKQYTITYYKIPEDDTVLKTRDYCKRPLSDDFLGYPLKEERSTTNKNLIDSGKRLTNGKCDCSPTPSAKRSRRDISDYVVKNKHNDDTTFEDNFFDVVVLIPYTGGGNKLIYYVDEDTSIDYYQYYTNTTKTYYNSTIVVAADKNETLVTGLDHFSTYVFYIAACNENRTLDEQCGEVVMVYNRTRRSHVADNLNLYYVAEAKSGTGVLLNWSNPIHPNALITSYTVEWKSESSNNYKCVHPTLVTKNGLSLPLPAGDYQIRVRVNTLAGSGEFTAFQRCDIRNPNNIDYYLMLGAGIFILLIAAGVVVYWRYKKKLELENMHLIQSINPDYCGPTYVVDEWEVERDNLEIGPSLGHGTFGIVYSGILKANQLPCAIKSVNINATYEERMEFLNEGSVMKTFSNAHHVVRLLGIVSRGPNPLVIMELMECGDLKTFLRRSRDSSQSIGCNEMYRMAIEMADGMAYLAAKKFVHRDLAARNCMVADDHTIKIGDFGMARDIYETDYYRKDSQGLLPVRWMAPESLADGVFTTDSDVWSYGVVLWEMVTLAEQPYQGLGSAQVWQFVIAKGRLNRPPECPDLLYEIMEVCWRWHPNRRPLFTDIVAKLERHVSSDFQCMSFYHSREGNEHRLNAKERPYNAPAMAHAQRCSKNIFAHYHRSDENIDLYNDDCEPVNVKYPSNPNHRQNLLADYVLEDDCDVLPGTNGYASLSKSTP